MSKLVAEGSALCATEYSLSDDRQYSIMYPVRGDPPSLEECSQAMDIIPSANPVQLRFRGEDGLSVKQMTNLNNHK